MKAIRFEKTGGPEVLQYVDYDLPAPGPGQIRIKHTAIGVNFIDTYHRSGLYPLPLPSGLGSEAAGEIEALGPASPVSRSANGWAIAAAPSAPMPKPTMSPPKKW